MKQSVLAFGLCILGAPTFLCAAPPMKMATQASASATKARDIGGVALGMPISEVREMMALSPLGDGEFEGVKDGISYKIEFSPLGRAFNIMTSQALGSFEIDRSFLLALSAKLIAKYGPAESPYGDTFSWDLIEPVQRANGDRTHFTTNWAYASIGGDPMAGEKSLEFQMVDFRIMWADRAKLNNSPRQAGADALKF